MLRLLNPIRRMSTNTKSITANSLFVNIPKDVWTMTAEITGMAKQHPKNANREMISLGQGFFSYSPPQFLLDATSNALNSDPLNNQYAPTRGDLRLIESIKNYYNQFYDGLQNENITITTGANEAILAILIGLLNPHEEVIVLEPFFDQYISNIKIPQGKSNTLPFILHLI